MMTLTEAVRELVFEKTKRRRNDTAIARASGLQQPWINKFLNGRSNNLTVDQAAGFARAFGMEVGPFLQEASDLRLERASERASERRAQGSEGQLELAARPGVSLRESVTHSEATFTGVPSQAALEAIAEGDVKRILESERVKPDPAAG